MITTSRVHLHFSFLALFASAHLAHAGMCTTPKNVYSNPFSKASAHHRPIGTNAIYAAATDPSTKSWLKNTSRNVNINVGAPWGVSVAYTDSTDRIKTIGAGPKNCDAVKGLPVDIRFPRNGFITKVVYNSNGCTDGVAVIYDSVAGVPHQIRQYNWNNGNPIGGQHVTWNIKGLGHGTKMGERLGTSASGVAALFGVLRGEEINDPDPDRKIEHAIQISLPGKPGSLNMMGQNVVLPAVSRDKYCSTAGYCAGGIPYGALMALLPESKGGPDLSKLGLTMRGKRLAEAIRNYGLYTVDTAGAVAIRADQYVANVAELKADLAKIYPYIRRVMNNDVLNSSTAGGGTALAPNCAFDSGN